jgi:hypothetical protein
MSFAAVLLTPFVLLVPAGAAIEPLERHAVVGASVGETAAGTMARAPGNLIFSDVAERFRLEAQNQVRIEQHMTIRIAPQSRPVTLPPRFMLDMPQRQLAPRFVERNIGRCVSIANITSVQPDTGSRLILFLRDRRMISAMLDRACRARDFYSGFYVERASDGRLCVDRDTLLSRSGANCKLTRIRQLIDPDE